MAQRVRSFDAKLRKRSTLPTRLMVETLTTRAARERIGPTRRTQRSKTKTLPPHQQVDAVAAQIIGEQFLAQNHTDAKEEKVQPC